MDTDLSEAVNRLPKDWWKTIEISSTCSNLFKGYILGLMLSGKIYGTNQTTLFSGFLFEFENTLIWFTAGHVIECINRILSDNNPDEVTGRWMDWETIPGAESIPVNFKEFHPFSSQDYSHDLGMYILGPLETEIIRKNEHSICFHVDQATDIQNFEPEGYFLLGFPASLREEARINQFQSSFKSALVCLPIAKIPFSPDLPFQTPNPNAFHGKIIDFPDSPSTQFSVPGMSGGPVIGIKRDPLKGIDYRLFAIQSDWLSESRLIRAEPILEPVQWIKEIWNSSRTD